MDEVVVDLVAAEAADVVADDEALAERFVDGHGQPSAQFGEADEQHAQAPFGVHAEVGEQAEILEDVVAEAPWGRPGDAGGRRATPNWGG